MAQRRLLKTTFKKSGSRPLAAQMLHDIAEYNDQQINALAGKGINPKLILRALKYEQRLNNIHKTYTRDALHVANQFQETAQHWEKIAKTDELTKIPNSRAFGEALDKMLTKYRAHLVNPDIRQALPDYAIAFIDIDKFKPLNDTYGHEAGDEALKTLARKLTHVTRSEEAHARLHGDEFVLLLIGDPHSNIPFAEHAKNRLDRALKDLCISDENGNPMQFTNKNTGKKETPQFNCSIGIHHVDDHHMEPSALMKKADNNMYVEKRGKGVARDQDPPVDTAPAPGNN